MIRKFIRTLQIFFAGRTTIKKFIPGIAWFFILLILLCIPGRDLPDSGDWMQKIFIDKWVHTGLFGLLAFLFMAPVYGMPLSDNKKWIYVIVIAILVSSWGLTTEFIQGNFVSGRTFDLFDWMADTLGASMAIFLSRYYLLHPPITLK